MTPAERALLLVIEALRMVLKMLYRQDERATIANRAMGKLDEAADLLKQGTPT